MRALLFFVFAVSSFAVQANPQPLKYFLKDSDYRDVALSPSGERIAARAQFDGKVVLIVKGRATMEVIGGIQPGSNDAISSFSWVNEDRLVFTYAEQSFGSDQRFSMGELFAVDFDGSDPDMPVGFRASNKRAGSRLGGTRKGDRAAVSMIDVLEDDEDHILIVKFPFSPDGWNYSMDGKKPPIVSKLNVYSGKQRTVERLEFKLARPLTDKQGEIRFVSYQTEDDLTKSAYRPNKVADWQLLSDAFELDDDLSVVGLSDAGNAVFLYGPHGEEGFRKVFRFDFEENIYEPVSTNLDADIVNWLADPDTGEIVIGCSRRGKVKHHYKVRENRYQGLHRALAKAYGDQTLSVMSRSADGKDMILRASSDTNPGSIFIFNTEAKRAEFFWTNRSWMDPNQMRPMQIDKVKSKDGFSISVRLTLPATDEPAPLIVNPHVGSQRISDDWAFNHETQRLASRGYAVLQVNFRGSGGFGKKFEDAGHREWGGKMIEDLAEAARWAMARDNIDQDRVCAYGGRYVAYASYMLAVREPDMLPCVIGYVGAYDLNIMNITGDIPKSLGGAGYLERVIGLEKAALVEFSPTTHTDRIKATPMLIDGKDDIRAPIDHAYAMRDALEEVDKDPKWLTIDDGGHGAGSLKNRLELYEGLLGFLDSNTM